MRYLSRPPARVRGCCVMKTGTGRPHRIQQCCSESPMHPGSSVPSCIPPLSGQNGGSRRIPSDCPLRYGKQPTPPTGPFGASLVRAHRADRGVVERRGTVEATGSAPLCMALVGGRRTFAPGFLAMPKLTLVTRYPGVMSPVTHGAIHGAVPQGKASASGMRSPPSASGCCKTRTPKTDCQGDHCDKHFFHRHVASPLLLK